MEEPNGKTGLRFSKRKRRVPPSLQAIAVRSPEDRHGQILPVRNLKQVNLSACFRANLPGQAINKEHGAVIFPEDAFAHRIKKVLEASEMYFRRADVTPTEDRAKDNAQHEVRQVGHRQVPAAEPGRPVTCTHSVGSIHITRQELRRINNALYPTDLHSRVSINYRVIRTARAPSQREK